MTVLANYPSSVGNKAALIEITVKKRKVILSGVHFEYTPYVLDRKDQFLVPIKTFLLSRNQESALLMSVILQRMIIKTEVINEKIN